MTGIQETFKDIISKILLLEAHQIRDDLSRDDNEDWDSMTHLVLVSEFEQAFGIVLSDDDIVEIETIGDFKKILIKYGVNII
ncbi:MAG: acyl carrier protein [Candidatus Hodarchaeota archaeon]